MELPCNYDDLSREGRRLVKREYINKQRGFCHFCGKSLTGPVDKEIKQLPIDKTLFPPGFFDTPIHLHHNHDTNMTIGAVHAYCNAVLWVYHGE